jgi:hypothetical protein
MQALLQQVFTEELATASDDLETQPMRDESVA